MGRNEIKLRRQRTTARGIERYRNYNSVLQRHESNQRIRKVMKVFGLFTVILIIIMIILFLSRWEKKKSPGKTSQVTVLQRDAIQPVTNKFYTL